MKEEFLDEKTRAEDIILGSLGIGQEARLIELKPTKNGYRGVAAWSDGKRFTFESEDELDDLQRWALTILKNGKKKA